MCQGKVWHCRYVPAHHEFTNRVTYVWVDPDHPEQLTDHHRWWATSGRAPVQFRLSDYGDGDATVGGLGAVIRDELGAALGRADLGEVRMLSQARRWGWLFNPITVFVVWASEAADTDPPVGAVLEVTNTPWKERHRYPIALDRDGTTFNARFDKSLHVSPFLDEDFEYRGAITLDGPDVGVRLDVHRHGSDDPTVATELRVTRVAASSGSLSKAMRSQLFPTHAVSLGIHAQAARLALKRVPFISHPDKREAVTSASSASNDGGQTERDT